MFYTAMFWAMWLIWIAIWVVMARRVKTTVHTESLGQRLLHLIPLYVAFYLLVARSVPWPALEIRFVPRAYWPANLGIALTIAGLALAVWARLWLAGNWSGYVTLKSGHELITTGPYRYARHPIYTGLLLALIGTGIAVGEVRALLAVLLAAGSFWWKLRREEALMRSEFGSTYVEYAARVKALVPGVV